MPCYDIFKHTVGSEMTHKITVIMEII